MTNQELLNRQVRLEQVMESKDFKITKLQNFPIEICDRHVNYERQIFYFSCWCQLLMRMDSGL